MRIRALKGTSMRIFENIPITLETEKVLSINPGIWGTGLTGQAITWNYRGVNGRFFLTPTGPGT